MSGTPAQFVRSRHPGATRVMGSNGYQIVANGLTLGRSTLPNHAWEVAARAVARGEGNDGWAFVAGLVVGFLVGAAQ